MPTRQPARRRRYLTLALVDSVGTGGIKCGGERGVGVAE
jgi:hypothetical protein